MVRLNGLRYKDGKKMVNGPERAETLDNLLKKLFFISLIFIAKFHILVANFKMNFYQIVQ